jgi:hypothetical protein
MSSIQPVQNSPTTATKPPPDPKILAKYGWIVFAIGAAFAIGAVCLVLGNSGNIPVFSQWRPGMGRRGGGTSWYLVLVLGGFGFYVMRLGITQVLEARKVANNKSE